MKFMLIVNDIYVNCIRNEVNFRFINSLRGGCCSARLQRYEHGFLIKTRLIIIGRFYHQSTIWRSLNTGVATLSDCS